MYSEEFINHIITCRNYRELLDLSLQYLRANAPKTSVANISLKAGFKSRNHIRELISGKRPMTLKSLTGLKRALPLPSEVREIFEYLVYCDQNELAGRALSQEQILNRLERLRERLRQKYINTRISIFEIENGPLVYAAFPTLKSSVTIKQLASKTGLKPYDVRAALVQLITLKLVEFDSLSRRYSASDNQMTIDQLGDNEGFKKYFLREIEKSKELVRDEFDQHLFYSSIFPIKANRIDEYKKELRSLLNKFVDDYESAHGDKVVHLTTCFFDA